MRPPLVRTEVSANTTGNELFVIHTIAYSMLYYTYVDLDTIAVVLSAFQGRIVRKLSYSVSQNYARITELAATHLWATTAAAYPGILDPPARLAIL